MRPRPRCRPERPHRGSGRGFRQHRRAISRRHRGPTGRRPAASRRPLRPPDQPYRSASGGSRSGGPIRLAATAPHDERQRARPRCSPSTASWPAREAGSEQLPGRRHRDRGAAAVHLPQPVTGYLAAGPGAGGTPADRAAHGTYHHHLLLSGGAGSAFAQLRRAHPRLGRHPARQAAGGTRPELPDQLLRRRVPARAAADARHRGAQPVRGANPAGHRHPERRGPAVPARHGPGRLPAAGQVHAHPHGHRRPVQTVDDDGPDADGIVPYLPGEAGLHRRNADAGGGQARAQADRARAAWRPATCPRSTGPWR